MSRLPDQNGLSFEPVDSASMVREEALVRRIEERVLSEGQTALSG